MTLPQNKRLSRESFNKTATSKDRRASVHFSITIQTTAHNGQCAVVVSKKVAKSAVARHKLKRRIYESIAPFCTKNRSYIVYARAGAPTLSFSALKTELTALLSDGQK